MGNNNNVIPTLNIDRFQQLHFSGYSTTSKDSKINQEDFIIQRLENTVNTLKLPIPPHRKTVFDLILVVQGQAERTFGLNSYSLRKNQIFFMPYNQITSTPSISPDIKGYYFHFNLYFVDRLVPYLEKLNLFKLDQNPLISLHESEIEAIYQSLETLEMIYISNGKNKKELIALKLMALLYEIDSYLPSQSIEIAISTSEKITFKFKQLLNEKIRVNKKVKDYADLLNITSNHLNKCVKSVTGNSANYWIQEMRLLESKTLLNQSELTISDIAFSLNFEDISYFSRFFKANTGLSPTEYRKERFHS